MAGVILHLPAAERAEEAWQQPQQHIQRRLHQGAATGAAMRIEKKGCPHLIVQGIYLLPQVRGVQVSRGAARQVHGVEHAADVGALVGHRLPTSVAGEDSRRRMWDESCVLVRHACLAWHVSVDALQANLRT